jgi:hypothetical protein
MQLGCMKRNSRKRGPDVWQFRWSEISLDGNASPSRWGGNMAPLDFGPYLCPLNSASFMSLQPWIHPPIALFAADHRTAGRSMRSQVVERFGVPTADHFEHLAAIIAEATPLYELCLTVLE